MTSPDGITWTLQSGDGRNYTSVTYGKDIFIAVGPDGVMTSPDGVTWQFRGKPAANLLGVTYANDLYVAVGTGPNTVHIITSTDPLCTPVAPDTSYWTTRLPGSIDGFNRVTYGNGVFVAVGSRGVYHSSDGTTWNPSGVPKQQWRSVTYGNNTFVAVSSNQSDNQVVRSSDGINWTAHKSAADKKWTSVAYGNGRFVAVGEATSIDDFQIVMTSGAAVATTTTTTAPTNGTYALVDGTRIDVTVTTNNDGQLVITGTDFSISFDDQSNSTNNVIELFKGGSIDYSGTGFRPESIVTATITPTDSQLGSTKTRASGAFTGQLTPRSATKSGMYVLRIDATGKNSQKISVFANTRIRSSSVAASDALPATGNNSSILMLLGVALFVGGLAISLRRRIMS
jgi:LPXTG-motif cell wall-anchored protein